MDYSTCRRIDHFHFTAKAAGYEYDYRFSQQNDSHQSDLKYGHPPKYVANNY